MNRKCTLYFYAVIAVAAVFIALYLPPTALKAMSWSDWRALLVFAGIGVLAQAAAIDFGKGQQATSSMAFIPLLASAMVLPPPATFLTAAVCIGVSDIFFLRRSALKAAFNTAQIVLATGLAAVAYTAMLNGEDRTRIVALGAVAVVVLFFATNLVLSSIGLALYREQPFVPTFRNVVGPRGANLFYDILNSPFVIMTVAVHISLGPGFVLLMILPLLLFRKSYADRLKLEHSNRDLLHALVKAIETRDPYTSGHSIRVATLSRLIAEDLGLSSRKVNRVRTAALLHDVGKIGVPDAILLKPGKLTAEEWPIMQGHASIGARILGQSASELLQAGAIIALSHHEKWDGSGYPRGLKGEEIPLCGRLMAVADVYDALVSERVYKKAMPHDEAVALIVADRGRHFDPVLTDVFREIAPSFRAIHDRFSDRTAG